MAIPFCENGRSTSLSLCYVVLMQPCEIQQDTASQLDSNLPYGIGVRTFYSEDKWQTNWSVRQSTDDQR